MIVTSTAKEDDVLRLVAASAVWSAITRTPSKTRADYVATTLMFRAVDTLTRAPMESKLLDEFRKTLRKGLCNIDWEHPPTEELERVGEAAAITSALYIAETVGSAMMLYGDRANAVGERMDEDQERLATTMRVASGES